MPQIPEESTHPEGDLRRMTRKKTFGKETPVSQSAPQSTVSALRLAPSAAEGPADLGDLMLRVAHGDEQAFAAVYDALGASVYGLARRVVRDPSRAEEIS